MASDMRLYRGLKEPFRRDSGDLLEGQRRGVDFTDCPFTALRYAATRRGVVLVLDLLEDASVRVTEELWLGMKAKRLMVWGRFEQHIVATISAKELRAEVRRRGIVGFSDEDKGIVLRRFIARRLAPG